MYLVTGPVASGTTLTSSYLHACGINMVQTSDWGNYIANTPVFEEFKYVYLFIANGKLKLSNADVRVFRNYIKEDYDTYGSNWGFKMPRATRHLRVIVENVLSICDISLIYVYRDISEIVESRMYRKAAIKSYYRTASDFHYNEILDFHKCFIKDYLYLKSRVKQVTVVKSTELQYSGNALSIHLGLPEKRPISDVLIPTKLLAAQTTYNNCPDAEREIYSRLDALKWNYHQMTTNDE